MKNKRFRLLTTLLFALLLSVTFADQAKATTTTWSWGGGDYNWGNLVNWDNGVPNNNGTKYDAVISGSPTIYVNGKYTIDTLNSSATLQIGSRQWLALELDSSISANNGRILLNDTSSYSGYHAGLFINGDLALNGTGSVEFTTQYQNYINDGDGSGYLTVGENQTIKTDGVAGHKGFVNVGLTNNGTISADNGDITLTSADKINNNLIQAVNGGTMTIQDITLTNNGQLQADSSSRLLFSGANIVNSGETITTAAGAPASKLNESVITGGTVNFGGDLALDAASGSSHLNSAGGSLTLDGATTINTSSKLYLTGDLTNNGRILLNDTSSYSGYQAELFINGDLTLNGTGSVEFTTQFQNYINDGDGSGYLTVGENQTIKTDGVAGNKGYVNVGLTSNGTISADNGYITLTSVDKTNNSLIQAVNSGWIGISGINLTNTGATLSVDDTSIIQLNNSTLTGGMLSGNGIVDIAGTSILDGTGEGIVMTPTARIDTSEKLYLKGGLTNNGRILLNDTSSYSGYHAGLFVEGDVALNGTGSVEFTTPYQNYINDGDDSGYLTVGENQTIKTDGVAGHKGYVNVGLTNNGTISADNGDITLSTTEKTNNSLIQAINGGTMTIQDITLTNNGQLQADSSSRLLFSGANIVNSGETITTAAGAPASKLNESVITGGTVNFGGDLALDAASGSSHLNSAGGNLTLGGATTINTKSNLHLTGDLTNNGRILLNDTSSYNGYQAELFINGDLALNGAGSVEFTTPYQNYINDGDGSGYLTVGENQTIKTDGVAGHKGFVNVGLTNNGTISADNGYITLSTADKTNNSLIQAINGGWLGISGINLTNTGAILSVDDTSIIQLNNSTLTGGMLSGDGTVDIAGTSILDGTGGGIEMTPTIRIDTNENLYLKGSLTNNGRILLNDTSSHSGYQAGLFINGDVALNGTGSVEFTTQFQNYINDGDDSGYLTVGENQTIKTENSGGNYGEVHVAITNEGTVHADNGTIAILGENKTNNGLMKASNGGKLDVYEDIDGAGRWVANGGKIQLNNDVDVTTTGSISVTNGGELELNNATMTGSDLLMDSTSILDVNSSIALTGSLSFAITEEDNWSWAEDSSLIMNGGEEGPWSNWMRLEIGGNDIGLNASGFSDNFDLRHLQIGETENDACIYLADWINNGNRSSDEALYVDDLDVLTEAILNLNGLNLYTMYNDGSGLSPYLVKAGDGYLFGGGQIIDAAVPIPASLFLLGSGLLAFIGIRRRRS